jgi:hypothetical protein
VATPRPRSRSGNDLDEDAGEELPMLSYAVGRLDRIIRTRLGEVLAPLDLTVAQMTTLSVLARRPVCASYRRSSPRPGARP